MRLDQVDGDPAAAGRVGHAKLEQRIDIAALGIGQAAAEKEVRTFLTDRHGYVPCVSVEAEFRRRKREQMVNAAVTLSI